MRKSLIILLLISICVTAHAVTKADFSDRAWWISQCGEIEGSLNDVIGECLLRRGYEGKLNDQLHGWLVHETGKEETSSLNDLIYTYFVAGVSENVSNNQVKFNSKNVVYNGKNVVYNGS